MVTSAALETSLRHEIFSHIADKPFNFQFSLKQLLSRRWANLSYLVDFTPLCPELQSGCELPRFHAQFWIWG